MVIANNTLYMVVYDASLQYIIVYDEHKRVCLKDCWAVRKDSPDPQDCEA